MLVDGLFIWLVGWLFIKKPIVVMVVVVVLSFSCQKRVFWLISALVAQSLFSSSFTLVALERFMRKLRASCFRLIGILAVMVVVVVDT